MSNWKKKIFIVTLSGMTVLTLSACRWQYNRYKYSVKKWSILDGQFKSETPQQIFFENLPWENIDYFDADDFEFKLVGIYGNLLSNRFYIHRHSESRPGFLIVGALVEGNKNKQSQNGEKLSIEEQSIENKKAFAVNLGWIPSHKKEEFDQKQQVSKEIYLTALLKRPEKIDIVNQNAYEQQNAKEVNEKGSVKLNQQNKNCQKFNSFIDLFDMKEKLNCNLEQKLFLEQFKVGSDYENEEENEDLYPVVSSRQTFSKPYLTPDKHLSYCTFWGCCSVLGVYTVAKLLFKM